MSAVMLPFALAPAEAQENPPEAQTTLPPVNVTAAPILPGLPDLDKVPSTAQIFDRDAITRSGYPTLLKTLNDQAGGVTLDDAQGNPWQPNLIYHGFEASPQRPHSDEGEREQNQGRALKGPLEEGPPWRTLAKPPRFWVRIRFVQQ